MEEIEQLFIWFAENEAGLSGVAALIVILGVLFSIIAGLRTFLVTLPKQNANLRKAMVESNGRAAPLSFFTPGEITEEQQIGSQSAQKQPQKARFDGPPPVAILPFDCLHRDDSLDHIALAIQDDLITGLSRSHSFPVISRSLVNSHLEDVADPRKLSENVGAHYLVEGTIRPAGNEIRVSVQLIEGPTGRHVWSGSFTGDGDVQSGNHSLGHYILGQLQGHLRLVEAERVGKADLEDLDVWGLTIRAYKELTGGKEVDVEAIERSELAARRVLEVDPSNGTAHMMLATTCFSRSNIADDPEETERLSAEALDRGAKAVTLAPRDPQVLALWGLILVSCRQSRRAISVLERAIEIDSTNARTLATLGRAYRNAGMQDKAVETLRHAIELGPDEPLAFIWHGWLAGTFLIKRDFKNALESSLKATALGPGNSWAWLILASTLGHMGMLEKGQKALEQVGEIRHSFTLPDLPRIVRASFETESAVEPFVEGLQKIVEQ